MKILLAGDTHGNTSHLITLLDIAVAQGCDRIFQVGDFGAWEHTDGGVRFFDDVERHARNRHITVYWLDGNHDKISLVWDKYGHTRDEEGFLNCRPHIKYAPRGHTWTWEDTSFISLGGAYSVDKDIRLVWEAAEAHKHGDDRTGRYWFPEEEMTDENMDSILARLDRVDVILAHDKPRASNPGWNRKAIPECWPNQDRIQQAVEHLRPDLLVHGHLHYRYDDWVEHPEGRTKVVGLDSDPSSCHSGFTKDSWTILTLHPDLGEDDD